MTTLTTAQQNFVNMFDGEGRENMTSTLINGGLLYASVVVCMNGQYSTGSMSLNDDPVPALDTRESIEVEIAEEAAELARLVEEGARDEDDEIEMELMAVRWNSDDTLSFYAPDQLEHELSRQSIDMACGTL